MGRRRSTIIVTNIITRVLREGGFPGTITVTRVRPTRSGWSARVDLTAPINGHPVTRTYAARVPTRGTVSITAIPDDATVVAPPR